MHKAYIFLFCLYFLFQECRADMGFIDLMEGLVHSTHTTDNLYFEEDDTGILAN